jgi:hypothetical protein
MLHVTNGDAVLNGFRAGQIPGDYLPWRDPLHDGPVPEAESLEALSDIRARAFANSGWSYDDIRLEFAERDRRLAGFRDHAETVLWFEHDLYDQLQLLQVLNQLAADGADWRRVMLICGAEYLGLSTADRLRERFPQRARVGAAMVTLAQRAWKAFRAPDPTGLVALLDDDVPALPFLGPALRRHLEQFPSTFNGLSRSEHQALEAIAGGATSVRAAFVESQRREDPFFLGDLVFASYMTDLSRGASPLVVLAGGGPVLDDEVRLTETGESVMRGGRDRVRLNGIDRWLGGVHLEGPDAAWRWDGRTVIPSQRHL